MGNQTTNPYCLHLQAPIDRWDEAIPLGNGLTGMLLWGEGQTLRLSLDRGDLWDTREPDGFRDPDFTWKKLRELVDAGEHDQMVRLFQKPFKSLPYPTKIPAARIELHVQTNRDVEAFDLDMKTGIGRASFGEVQLMAICHATQNAGLIKLTGSSFEASLCAPDYNGEPTTGLGHQRRLADLGYPPTTHGSDEHAVWFEQKTIDDFSYVVMHHTWRDGDDTFLAYTITTNHDADDPVAHAQQLLQTIQQTPYAQLIEEHAAWWAAFWSASDVNVPDAGVQQHYNLVNYYYGSASRRDAPPMPLQGVWTADEGAIPPWRGDYHNNLNTQLCYWPYLGANRLDAGLSFLDFMFDRLPVFREYARDFFDAPGAIVPGIMDIDGRRLGGWAQYACSPTNAAWVAHHFYLHWRYTMDAVFLAERAYVFCSEVGQALRAITEIDPATGKRVLPLSAAPEYHSNAPEAWMPPTSTYDLSLLRWLYSALVEMAETLDKETERADWQNTLNEFDELPVGETHFDGKVMLLAPDTPLEESHRHHNHLMPIQPLGTLTVEDNDDTHDLINRTLRQVARIGTGYWCGYSYSWMACVAARAGNAAMAEHNLDVYLKSTISRNGFHLNGDYKRLGTTFFDYRPFTLEGNFAAAQAVIEMLLQSWGGVVRLFPAIPTEWRDASFSNLRAEGAFLVSAKREDAKTISLQILAEKDGLLRLRNPFPTTNTNWSSPVAKTEGNDLLFELKAGQVLKASLD